MALTDDEILTLLDLEVECDVRRPCSRLQSIAWWVALTVGVAAAALILLQADVGLQPVGG